MLALLGLLVSGILFATLGQGSSITIRANTGCSFHLSTGGAAPFWIGQLPNGQARGGSNIQASTFTWFGDAFVDEANRGCWWTPPSNVLQCDVNQAPDHGWGIPCNGVVTFNGQSTFYQCSTGDGDQVNINLRPVGSQCQPITIVSDGCTDCQNPPAASAGPQPVTTGTPGSSSLTVTPFTTNPQSNPTSPGNSGGNTAPRPTALPPPAKDCPPDLTSNYHYPSLLVPVDFASPDKPYGSTSYGQVSPNASTLFNFDIPLSDAGKSCKVFFTLPSQSAIQAQQGSSYYLTGDGAVLFSRMGGQATSGTTYNDIASGRYSRRDLGALRLSPGNTYVVEDYDCPAGQTVSYMIAEPAGRDTCLVYYQEGAPVPVGLFVSTC